MESIFQYLPEILQVVEESPTALAALMFVLLAVLASILFKGSKGLSGIFAFIALLAFAFFVIITFNKASPQASQNQTTNPLQVGEYSYNNYNLDVTQRGERICIQAVSRNGLTVASVHVDPNNSELYKAYQYPDWDLKQVNPNTILFGGFSFTKSELQGFSQDISDIEQKCLDSTTNFFEHLPLDGAKIEPKI